MLSGSQWEACFHKVLFPLLTRLLDNISPHDPNSMDETRMRAASLLSKVFLQHLKDLLTSPTFTACWLTILDFMDKYMRVGNRDLLVSNFRCKTFENFNSSKNATRHRNNDNFKIKIKYSMI